MKRKTKKSTSFLGAILGKMCKERNRKLTGWKKIKKLSTQSLFLLIVFTQVKVIELKNTKHNTVVDKVVIMVSPARQLQISDFSSKYPRSDCEMFYECCLVYQ